MSGSEGFERDGGAGGGGTTGVFSRFLNVSKRILNGIPVVDATNPLNVGGLLGAVGAGIFTRIVVGIASLPEAATRAVTTILEGPSQFLTSLVTTPLDLLVDATTSAVPLLAVPNRSSVAVADFADVLLIEQLGPLALPAAVALALGVVYVLNLGFRAALGVGS